MIPKVDSIIDEFVRGDPINIGYITRKYRIIGVKARCDGCGSEDCACYRTIAYHAVSDEEATHWIITWGDQRVDDRYYSSRAQALAVLRRVVGDEI